MGAARAVSAAPSACRCACIGSAVPSACIGAGAMRNASSVITFASQSIVTYTPAGAFSSAAALSAATTSAPVLQPCLSTCTIRLPSRTPAVRDAPPTAVITPAESMPSCSTSSAGMATCNAAGSASTGCAATLTTSDTFCQAAWSTCSSGCCWMLRSAVINLLSSKGFMLMLFTSSSVM